MEAAFFDLDKTVISKSSSLALTGPMYRAGLVSRSTLLKGAYAQLVYLLIGADEKRMDKVKESLGVLTRGWEKSHVEEIVREALTELIDPYIYLEALDLMELHRARGRRVYIVSSSPEEVVVPLSEHLGPVKVIASVAEVEDGKYTGGVAFYAYGEHKGRGHAGRGRTGGPGPGGFLRLLRLHHRPADAGGRGPSGGGQSRPRSAASGRRTQLADPRFPPSCSASRTLPQGPASSSQRRRHRGKRGGGRGGRMVVPAARWQPNAVRPDLFPPWGCPIRRPRPPPGSRAAARPAED